MTKEALQKERESLEKKEKAFGELITSQKKKAAEESKIVEELKYTKGLLSKAHQDLDAQTNILNAKLEKVEASEVLTQTVVQLKEVSTETVSQINEILIQTVSELIEVSNVKQKKSEAISEEKKKSIPCKYFHKTKGCRRGEKCWFYHDYNPRVDKISTKLQQKFKVEPKKDKELKQEQGASLKQVILELLKLLLRESDT